jgi:acyl-CoA thioesterase FadM
LSFIDQKSPFLEIEEKVRYSETDQMGVAHNKCYFEWFEIDRTEYCRHKGIPYKDINEFFPALQRAQGIFLLKKRPTFSSAFLLS